MRKVQGDQFQKVPAADKSSAAMESDVGDVGEAGIGVISSTLPFPLPPSHTHTLTPNLTLNRTPDPDLTPSADVQRMAGSLPVPAKGSWVEWKARCAIGLCSDPVQTELRSFAAIHFTLYLRRYAYRTNSSFVQADLAEGEAWHLFETHLAVRNTRQGKRYKEWLFARMPGTERDDLESLAGGAALIMRDAAREHLRREYTPTDFISLNSPVQGVDSAGLTLEDLLPGTMDPVDEVANREFERLAVEHAKDLIADMSRRDKIALLAKELGISLAHPEVEKAAGCRKSVLNESYQNFILGTAEKMKKAYSKDDPDSVRVLTLLTLREIKGLVRIWADSSAESGRLLSIAEVP